VLKAFMEKALPGAVVSPLEATYLVWIDFAFLGKDEEGLKQFMIKEAGLGLNDGSMFGPGGANHQRLNIATTTKVLQKGLEQLANAVDRMA
jgi:cystathionine beta-lyase